MLRSLSFALAAATLTVAVPAVAQTDQMQPGEVVVTAPIGLNAKQLREWNDLNDKARDLTDRMGKLRSEARDDTHDVKEAEDRLGDAQDKLKHERKDQERTQKDIRKVQKEFARVTQRRNKLRAKLPRSR